MRHRWFGAALLCLAVLAAACRPPAPGDQAPIRFRSVPLDPGEHYTVQLWDFRYPLGPLEPYATGGERYREALAADLAAFGQTFPNVTVEITLLDFDSGDQVLLEALAAGTPPDVFAAWWAYPRPGHELAVPVAPYLKQDEAAAYHPLAWKLSGEAAWPRWLFPMPVLARADLLPGLDLETIRASGWEWGDLREQGAAAARQGRGRYGIVAASGESALRWLLAGQGAGLFTRGPELPRALEWVRQAIDGGALLAGEEADDRAVELFTAGKAALLVGANPALARLLTARPGVVLLPFPRFGETATFVPVAAAHLVVFRQRDFKGLEHTQAAVELARWLSRSTGLFPGHLLLGLPAHGEAAEEGLLPAAGEGLCLYPGHGLSPEEFAASLAAREHLARWWAGALTDGELEERLRVLLPVFAPRR